MTGEHFSADVRHFLATLARHRVRFLVIGGEAVIHHGHARLTGDLDLWYEQTPANTTRLYAALSEFWEGVIPGVTGVEDLREPGVFVLFGRPPNRVDLLSRAGSVDFRAAWRRRETELVGASPTAFPLPFAGLTDLIRMKQEAARPKDLDDLAFLRKARSRRRAT